MHLSSNHWQAHRAGVATGKTAIGQGCLPTPLRCLLRCVSPLLRPLLARTGPPAMSELGPLSEETPYLSEATSGFDPKRTLGLMALAPGRPSVDLGQRQRSFGAHAMFSRT